MDREADFFELFDEQRKTARVELLVREKHHRVMPGETHLFEAVRQSAVQGALHIVVPRQSARPKKSKQKARSADVQLRHLNDPPPGHQLMWQGYAVLQMLRLGFSLRPPDTS